MITWKEQQILIDDKQQTKLSPDGCKPNDFIFAQDRKILKFDDIVTCPFCLEFDRLHYFKKVIYGLFQCPNCKNEMRGTSLILDMNIEKFVKWVFDYRKNGFFQKIYPDFKTWCNRLKELRISYDFWENYNRLKGVSDNEENENEFG